MILHTKYTPRRLSGSLARGVLPRPGVLPAALARGERILVLCNANTAVDSVLEKVSLSGGGAVILRVVCCHRLPFLRDLHTNLAVIVVICCPNNSVAPG